MRRRECGGCHACCYVSAVASLSKPACTMCPRHQEFDGKGCCSSYDSRPSECGVYTCSWIDGDLPANWRPDRCGLLFESGHCDWPRHIVLLTGFELRPGAIEESRRWLPSALRPGSVAIIVPFEEYVGEGSSIVRDRAGEAAGLPLGGAERCGPAGSDTGGGRGTPVVAADRRGRASADGCTPSDGEGAAEVLGGNVQWFGRERDVNDARRFFAMCQREGSLTMRMADGDVEMQL